MKTSRPWTKKPELYPGWKMTRPQHRTYWNLLSRAHKAYTGVGRRCPAASGPAPTGTQSMGAEEFRALIHGRAFGKNVSAKEIDRMKMFDQFKSACMAIIEPSNLTNQMAIEHMPKTRLIHRIITDFPASYILCLMNSPRFARCRQNEQRAGLEDLEHWTEKDLTDLRTILCARNPSSVSMLQRVPNDQSDSPDTSESDPMLEQPF